MIEFSLKIKGLNLTFNEAIEQSSEIECEKIIQLAKELDLFFLCNQDPILRENLYSLHDKFISILLKPYKLNYLDSNAIESDRPFSDSYKLSRKITKHLLIASLYPSKSEMRRKDTHKLWSEAIDKLPKGQAGKVLLLAHPMFCKKKENNNLLTVRGVASLPPVCILDVVKTLASNLNPDMLGYQKTFTVLGEQNERCLEVLTKALPFIHLANANKLKAVTDHIAAEIIEEISQIQDQEILEWSQKLAEKDNVLNTIKSIRLLDPTYRSELLKKLGPILKKTAKCNPSVSSADVFDELAKLPKEEVLDVLQKTLNQTSYLFSDKANKGKREHVYKIIKNHQEKK